MKITDRLVAQKGGAIDMAATLLFAYRSSSFTRLVEAIEQSAPVFKGVFELQGNSDRRIDTVPEEDRRQCHELRCAVRTFIKDHVLPRASLNDDAKYSLGILTVVAGELLQNAARYGDPGEVRVEIWLTERWLLLEVSNNTSIGYCDWSVRNPDFSEPPEHGLGKGLVIGESAVIGGECGCKFKPIVFGSLRGRTVVYNLYPVSGWK